jgi:uncharacterized membrane protein (DUF4010 family)
VLVEAVSLAGYVTWRLTLGARGLLLTGVLGGLVSSTATTLSYARQVAAGNQSPRAAVLVILLANATMLVRVLVLIGVVAPEAVWRAAAALLPALLAAVAGVAWRWKSAGTERPENAEPFRNPTQLTTALTFSALYTAVLLFTALAHDFLGVAGVLALAAVSGLTDVDAITLSSMGMLNRDTLGTETALAAVGVAIASNLGFKGVMASAAGGAALRGAVLRAFAVVLLALAAGLPILHALA